MTHPTDLERVAVTPEMMEEVRQCSDWLNDLRDNEIAHICQAALDASGIEGMRERVRELQQMLRQTVNMARLYASGTGTLFDETMAKADAMLLLNLIETAERSDTSTIQKMGQEWENG